MHRDEAAVFILLRWLLLKSWSKSRTASWNIQHNETQFPSGERSGETLLLNLTVGSEVANFDILTPLTSSVPSLMVDSSTRAGEATPSEKEQIIYTQAEVCPHRRFQATPLRQDHAIDPSCQSGVGMWTSPFPSRTLPQVSNFGELQKKKKAEKIAFDTWPPPSCFKMWRTSFKSEVSLCSSHPRGAMN